MNVITLLGRLTKDPEIKYGKEGKAYARFTLAVNRPFSKEETDFINCVCFGKTAEVIGEYVRKGNQLGVHGTLRRNTYEKDGEKRESYEVMIAGIDLIGGKKESKQEDRYGMGADKYREEDKGNYNDDEFPF